MQKTVSSKDELSDAIINSYYQRFYQGRKSNFIRTKSKLKTNNLSTQMSKTDQQFQPIQISQQQNLVFHIDYQQKPNSPQKTNSFHNNSEVSQLPTTSPQNNLFLEINIPSSPQKYLKSKFHSKPSPIKRSCNQQNSNNFLSTHPYCKNKNAKNQILNFHHYSKTMDLNQFIPQSNLSNEIKFISTPENDNIFTLDNFSSIQIHNDKKHSKRCKNREIREIVKRAQVSQILTLKPQQNRQKNSSASNITDQEHNQINKKGIEKAQSPSKNGLFNLFKPTIQLKKRPSTGIPLKKHQTVNSSHQIDEKLDDSRRIFSYSSNKLNSHNSPNKTKTFQKDFSRHNRTLSLKIQSPPKLSIKTREIKTKKHGDLEESQGKRDVLKDSIDLGSEELKNIVYIEQKRKKVQIRKKPRLNTLSMEEVEFLPWESAHKDDAMIEIIN